MSTGDLAAAIESSDQHARAAAAAVVVLVCFAVIALVEVAELRKARWAERAEWACYAEILEGERDDARARFKVNREGEIDDEGA